MMNQVCKKCKWHHSEYSWFYKFFLNFKDETLFHKCTHPSSSNTEDDMKRKAGSTIIAESILGTVHESNKEEETINYCEVCRNSEKRCGIDGKWFEPKDITKGNSR